MAGNVYADMELTTPENAQKNRPVEIYQVLIVNPVVITANIVYHPSPQFAVALSDT